MNDQPYRHASIYPQDAIAANRARMDVIASDEVHTLHELFRARVARSPDKVAYIQHCEPTDDWVEYTWRDMADEVAQWCAAIAADNFAPTSRAAIRMSNRREWVLCDQACIANNLVTVPLYSEDRADNIAYILEQTDTRLLLLENVEMWLEIAAELPSNINLTRVVILHDPNDDLASHDDPRVQTLAAWLPASSQSDNANSNTPPPTTPSRDDLATIVYTSGTTGKPKGVMLSHANMLTNAHAGIKSLAVFPDDKFLSFLPLSHMFERTVGYYLPMMAGASVAFTRSIALLPDDMAIHKPSMMITVPRIFERAYAAIKTRLEQSPPLSKYLFQHAVEIGWQRFEISQGRARWNVKQLLWLPLNALVAKKIRARFGGNLRCVISGGAPLAQNISRVFIALGVDILQGYGLTETSPTLTVNTLAHNKPATIGLPFSDTEIRLSPSGELQAKGTCVMQGYWQNPEATKQCIDAEGWFASGDIADIDADGFISITGRLKEIIVLDTGEKVPPTDMEAAICDHSLFEQVMVIGEGKAFLSALIVLNPEAWQQHAATLGINAQDESLLTSEQVETFILDKVAAQLQGFPGYAVIRRVCVTLQAWSVSNGALTPTLKIKRPVLHERFQTQIDRIYKS